MLKVKVIYSESSASHLPKHFSSRALLGKFVTGLVAMIALEFNCLLMHNPAAGQLGLEIGCQCKPATGWFGLGSDTLTTTDDPPAGSGGG